jgi:hypothetical protein
MTPQTLRDLVQSIVLRDALEAAGSAAEGVGQAIEVVDRLRQARGLRAELAEVRRA